MFCHVINDVGPLQTEVTPWLKREVTWSTEACERNVRSGHPSPHLSPPPTNTHKHTHATRKHSNVSINPNEETKCWEKHFQSVESIIKPSCLYLNSLHKSCFFVPYIFVRGSASAFSCSCLQKVMIVTGELLNEWGVPGNNRVLANEESTQRNLQT